MQKQMVLVCTNRKLPETEIKEAIPFTIANNQEIKHLAMNFANR